jgi:hypothetical protein
MLAAVDSRRESFTMQAAVRDAGEIRATPFFCDSKGNEAAGPMEMWLVAHLVSLLVNYNK